jgi:uncharacterized membrane protein YgcG
VLSDALAATSEEESPTDHRGVIRTAAEIIGPLTEKEAQKTERNQQKLASSHTKKAENQKRLDQADVMETSTIPALKRTMLPHEADQALMGDTGGPPIARGAILTAEHITLTPTDEELKKEKRRARQLATAHARKTAKDERVAEALVMESITIPNLEVRIKDFERNEASVAAAMAPKDTEIKALLARVAALEAGKRVSGEHVERLQEAVKDAGKAEEHTLRWRYNKLDRQHAQKKKRLEEDIKKREEDLKKKTEKVNARMNATCHREDDLRAYDVLRTAHAQLVGRVRELESSDGSSSGSGSSGGSGSSSNGSGGGGSSNGGGGGGSSIKRPRSDTDNGSATHHAPVQRRRESEMAASAYPPHAPPAVYYGGLVRQAIKEEKVERILVHFASLHAEPELPQATQSTSDRDEMSWEGKSKFQC